MGTARWCPPEKHGWQFHSCSSVEEKRSPWNQVQVARYHLSTWSIASDERRARFTPRNSRRQKAETGGSHTHRPPFLSNFPPAAASAKFNRILIFVAVSKWFPADRRRDALSHPRHSIKIRSAWVGRPSFQSVYVNDSKGGETISKAVSMPRDDQVYIVALSLGLIFGGGLWMVVY